ncbi:family 16 glycosylhydrolase [Pseudomonas sp. REP124]|uniref:family 16 glycosylhydrolase n=1 Tax=Pseudomonas sp. REP124 TaxID=2875731 RepID=UPI001CCCB4AE|nr:family 16 glycosylhydrolase [Pseudomonas sp. REP124]MBZ9781543.1 family 16 glycosylhydrolase [Pseudomonas sp. REP124]
MIRECLLGLLLISTVFEASAAPSQPPTEGLVMWLDAADASNVSRNEQGRVTRWQDKSGRGNDVNADNVAASALPAYVSNALNGHGVVRLSGTAAFSANALRTTRGPVTVFVVSRRLPEQAGGKAWQRLISSRPQLADNDNVAPNFGLSVQQTTAYEPALAFLESGDVPIGPLAVGRNVVGTSEILRGDIAEVLVYDRPLATQAERQAVFEYLTQKWKVAAPQQTNAWTRIGPLGPLPQRTNPNLPLSDQANVGQWRPDPRFTDDFNGNTLDPERWHVNNATGTDSLGRKPALFLPENATVSDGYLNIVFRKQTLPEKYVRLGYKDYSSAMVRTIERGDYGYYEARAKPMNSAGSSAFWLAWTGLADNATEIDIFEIGGKTKDAKFDRMYNMNAHVWATPTSTAHLAEGSTWISPWRFAEDFHVYGLDWQRDTLRWYVDGVLVREAKNSHFFFPMQIVFDSEAMWDWFGVVDDADLPSTFSVDYIKVWRRGN